MSIAKASSRKPAVGSLGGKLRTARLSKGWTQEEAAERLGVHLSTVSAWENDESVPRGNAAWAKITALYGIPRPADATRRPGLSISTAAASDRVQPTTRSVAEAPGQAYRAMGNPSPLHLDTEDIGMVQHALNQFLQATLTHNEVDRHPDGILTLIGLLQRWARDARSMGLDAQVIEDVALRLLDKHRGQTPEV